MIDVTSSTTYEAKYRLTFLDLMELKLPDWIEGGDLAFGDVIYDILIERFVDDMRELLPKEIGSRQDAENMPGFGFKFVDGGDALVALFSIETEMPEGPNGVD
jgi:hypothetical protein